MALYISVGVPRERLNSLLLKMRIPDDQSCLLPGYKSEAFRATDKSSRVVMINLRWKIVQTQSSTHVFLKLIFQTESMWKKNEKYIMRKCWTFMKVIFSFLFIGFSLWSLWNPLMYMYMVIWLDLVCIPGTKLCWISHCDAHW
jgi:hypothetical protein